MSSEHAPINHPEKPAEVYYSPTPYDYLSLVSIHDDRNIIGNHETYFPLEDVDTELQSVSASLYHRYGTSLMYVGLTGSRVEDPNKVTSDVDVISIIDSDLVQDEMASNTDLKVIQFAGLREFIECGYQLVTTQFRKSQPFYEARHAQAALDEARTWRVLPEKALPFLKTKSQFDEHTAAMLRQMSDRYKATYLDMSGYSLQAGEQLGGQGHDDLFLELLNQEKDAARLKFAQQANYCARLGVNKLFRAGSQMIEALHIQEEGEVADVVPLLNWAVMRLDPNISELYCSLYQKRALCFKGGVLLSDEDQSSLMDGVHSIRAYTQAQLAQ